MLRFRIEISLRPGQDWCFSKFDFLGKLCVISETISDNVVQKIIGLHKITSQLYAGQGCEKMATAHLILKKSSILTCQILADLQIGFLEPIEFVENIMKVDW